MAKHPKAGLPVKVANGPFKGRYFVVVDYFQNQFQGKDMKKLAVAQAPMLAGVKSRGYPVDGEVVFGRLYPTMEFICLHDKELIVDMKVVDTGGAEEVELPPNVESIKKASNTADKAKKKLKSVKKETPDDGGTAS